MDRITKVQEVSSFIKKFDCKYWNEVVLRLTIIGIRYIKNQCHHFFKWKLDDLALISEQLRLTKLVPSNFKTFYGTKFSNILKRNDNNDINKYNYNYSNSSYRKESKDKPNFNNRYNNNSNYKSKSLVTKKKYNDNFGNNDMSLILSEREIHGYNYGGKNWKNKIKDSKSVKFKDKKVMFNKYQKYNDEENEENKHINNRNKILSLNNNNINIVVSDFPFSEKSLLQNDDDNNINNDYDNISKVKDDILDINNSDNINMNNNLDDNANMKNNSCILSSTIEFQSLDNTINPRERKNNKYLLNRIKKSKDINNFKNQYNCSNDFIRQLRKMNHSKDKNNDLRSGQSFQGHKINVYNSSKSFLVPETSQKLSYKSSFKMNHNFDSIKEESIPSFSKNKDSDKKNYDKLQINDFDSIQSDIKKQFDTDTTIEANSNNYYLYKNADFVNLKKTNYNKYLKNQNYKNKYNNSTSYDSSLGRINNSKYIENNINFRSPEKENKNSENIIEPSSDRYFCNYAYDINKKSI